MRHFWDLCNFSLSLWKWEMSPLHGNIEASSVVDRQVLGSCVFAHKHRKLYHHFCALEMTPFCPLWQKIFIIFLVCRGKVETQKGQVAYPKLHIQPWCLTLLPLWERGQFSFPFLEMSFEDLTQVKKGLSISGIYFITFDKIISGEGVLQYCLLSCQNLEFYFCKL